MRQSEPTGRWTMVSAAMLRMALPLLACQGATVVVGELCVMDKRMKSA